MNCERDADTTNKALRFQGWVLALLLVTVSLVYAPSVPSPFTYDDEVVVLKNQGIQSLEPFKQLYPIHYRHFFFMSFALNYHFGKLDPSGYRLFNITVHMLTVTILWFLVRITLERGAGYSTSTAGALATATAGLFVFHPVHTEAITYISGRGSSFSGLFVLVSILAFVLGNRSDRPTHFRFGCYALSWIAGFMAVFTKETSAMLALLIPLYDLCFMRGAGWNHFRTRACGYYVPLGGLGILMVALSPNLLALGVEWLGRLEPGYAWRQLSVLPFAAKLVLFPINLVFDYDFSDLSAPSSGWSLWGVITTLMAGLAGWVWLYRRDPLSAFGIGWFLILLAPTNSFLPRMDLLSERNLYLPSIGLIFLTVIWAYRGLKGIWLDRPLYLAGTTVVTVLCLLYAGLVVKRNQVYQSNIALWEDVRHKSPGKARAYHNLSHFYLEAGDDSNAFLMLKKLAEADTTAYYRSYAHTNLGNLYARSGQIIKAEHEFKRALEIDPGLPSGYFNLGVLYASRGEHRKAADYLERAERAQAVFERGQVLPPTLNLFLANIYLQIQRLGEAERRITAYLNHQPESSDGRLLLGHILRARGDPNGAMKEYKRVRGSGPVLAEARRAMADLKTLN